MDLIKEKPKNHPVKADEGLRTPDALNNLAASQTQSRVMMKVVSALFSERTYSIRQKDPK